MSRRSFVDIQKDLDLSFHLKKVEEIELPWDPCNCFAKKSPLELEIGSGKGLFIKQAAEENPAHNFMGVEISYRYALITAARLCKAGLENAVILQGDAAKVLTDLIPDHSLEAIHVLFPDPWWKKAHRKRRIMRTEVLHSIENKLRFEGKLHFWTDVEEYYLSTLELIAEQTQLQGPFTEEITDPPLEEEHFNTHFERRTLLKKLPVYRACFLNRKYD